MPKTIAGMSAPGSMTDLELKVRPSDDDRGGASFAEGAAGPSMAPFAGASAPEELPPSYAADRIKEAVRQASLLCDDRLEAELTRPVDPRWPSFIVEALAVQDASAVNAWLDAVRDLQEKDRLNGRLLRLLSGRGTGADGTPTLVDTLLTRAAPGSVARFLDLCRHACFTKQWLTGHQLAPVLTRPVSALRDAIAAGTDAARIVLFLEGLQAHLSCCGPGPHEQASFLAGGTAGGISALDAALAHPDTRVLQALLEMTIQRHDEWFKRPSDPGRFWLNRHHVDGLSPEEQAAILLPGETAVGGGLMANTCQDAVRRGAAGHLRVYLDGLLEGCDHHNLPVGLLVRGLSSVLPNGWTMARLKDRAPDCHAALVGVAQRAQRVGLLLPMEFGQLRNDGRIPIHPARHGQEHGGPARLHHDAATQTPAPPRRRRGPLSCFGPGDDE